MTLSTFSNSDLLHIVVDNLDLGVCRIDTIHSDTLFYAIQVLDDNRIGQSLETAPVALCVSYNGCNIHIKVVH